jgi:BON domain-containing protein
MDGIEHIAGRAPAYRESAEAAGRVIVINFTLPPADAAPAPVALAPPARMAGSWPRTYQRPDELILDDLVSRLAASSAINAADVQLSCADGVVTASGTVSTRAEHQLLEALAVSTVGLADYVCTVAVSKARPHPQPAPDDEGGGGQDKKPGDAKRKGR